MTKKVLAVLAALGLTALVSGSAHAATNLVQNGDFLTLTGGTATQELNGGQLGNKSGGAATAFNATDWTTSGYNFLFTSPANATGGVLGSDGNLALWGPGSGSANGLTASPAGSTIVGADGAYEVGAINQTITGLTVGDDYDLTFYWAGAQQSGFTGPTTDKWTVSLGSQSQTTGIDSLASEGFSPWQQQTFAYQATSSSEVLSFLATGTPSGEPPFALLDGVSLIQTPEPSSLAAMFVGALCLGALIRRRVIAKKLAE